MHVYICVLVKWATYIEFIGCNFHHALCGLGDTVLHVCIELRTDLVIKAHVPEGVC